MTASAPASAVLSIPATLASLESFVRSRLSRSELAGLLSLMVQAPGDPREAGHLVREEAGFRLVVVRSAGSTALPDAVIAELTDSWTNAHDAESREVLLLEELAVDWESLQALYDLSGDLQANLEQKELLRRILRRATATVPGSSAVLLLQRDKSLVVAASVNCSDTGEFSLDEGLLGKVGASHQSLVLSGIDRIASTPGLEPIWNGAVGIALAPITIPRRGLFGVVALWSQDRRARFNSHLVRLMEALGQQIALIVESDRLGRSLRQSERLQQEIQIGSLIQQMLLLSEAPRHHPYLDIATVNLASQTVDGDFLDLSRRPDDSLEVVVGDVMGKGIPAALIGAATKSHLLRASADVLLRNCPAGQQLSAILNLTAERMTPSLISLERFVTLTVARVEPALRQVRWVDCGHTSTLKHSQRDGVVGDLKGQGLPLGVMAGEVYTADTAPFEPGDTLLFYSDGVTEVSGPGGEIFGEERLAEILKAEAANGTAQLVEKIRAECTAFRGSSNFADDFTCLAVRFRPENEWPLQTSVLVLNGQWASLGKLHEWSGEFLSHPGTAMDSTTADLVHLALTEAVTNIMRHGAGGDSRLAITLHASVCADRWIFELEDGGPEWSPAEASPPEFDGSRSGGFGLFIIEQVMDHAVYLRLSNGTNRAIFTRLRRAPEEIKE